MPSGDAELTSEIDYVGTLIGAIRDEMDRGLVMSPKVEEFFRVLDQQIKTRAFEWIEDAVTGDSVRQDEHIRSTFSQTDKKMYYHVARLRYPLSLCDRRLEQLRNMAWDHGVPLADPNLPTPRDDGRALNRPRAASAGVKTSKRKPRPGWCSNDEDVTARRRIVAGNLDVSAKATCDLFHTGNIPLPPRMVEAGTWPQAYKSEVRRPAIDTMISKDKSRIKRFS